MSDLAQMSSGLAVTDSKPAVKAGHPAAMPRLVLVATPVARFDRESLLAAGEARDRPLQTLGVPVAGEPIAPLCRAWSFRSYLPA